jgi:hypothetical protein
LRTPVSFRTDYSIEKFKGPKTDYEINNSLSPAIYKINLYIYIFFTINKEKISLIYFFFVIFFLLIKSLVLKLIKDVILFKIEIILLYKFSYNI